MWTSRHLILATILAAGCATPSRGELAERNAEVQRLTSARAVFMPKEVESCVGVTLRLSDAQGSAESAAEREELSKRITLEEVMAATDQAGVAPCRDTFFDALKRRAVSPEPIQVSMSYGVDPTGRVCAVVEKERMEPIDAAAVPLLEESALCLKDALFRARFPADRVKDKERVVLTYVLVMDPARDPTRQTPPTEAPKREQEAPVGETVE